MNPQEQAIKNVGQNFSSIDIRGMTPAQVEAVRNVQKNFSQNKVVQDTSATRAKDMETASKIDETANIMTGNVQNNNNQPVVGSPVNSTNGDIAGADGNTYKQTAPSGYSYDLPPLADGKKYVYDQSGRPMVQDTTGAIANDPYADQMYEANKESVAKTTQYNTLLDNYKTGLDTTHTALINSIKEQAAQQRKKMEELNKRTLGAKTTQGYRTTGTAEYAPEIDTGILKAEEEEGLARLAEIDANMKLAIAQAQSAKTEKDFELAAKRLDTANQLQKAKEETIQNIYKAYLDNSKMIAEKLKAQEVEDRATADQALQELTVKAPELVKQYDALPNQAQKDAWLQLMVKKTGLDETILKGSMEKVRLDVRNKESIIEKRETPADKAISASRADTVKRQEKENDIAGAILYFQDIKAKNKWAGINPQDYAYYRSEILKMYGASAVLDFDKAIKSAGLEVDTGEGVL